jgi:hypothetical protein
MKIVLIVVTMFMLAVTGAAQDTPDTPPEPSRFRRALSLIPDIGSVRAGPQMFNYADYHASIESRGLSVPENVARLLEGDFKTDPVPHALAGGFIQMLLYTWGQGANYPETIGFDFFQVEQAVEISTIPLASQILIGDFDAGLIQDAYTRRSYTVERQDETGILLCPFGDCSQGMAADPAKYRNLANPFGGMVGRQELMFIGDGVLLNSATIPEIEAMIDTYTGGPSLADDPAYQALANVLAGYPYINGVAAYNPLAMGQLSALTLARDPDTVAALEAHPIAPYAAMAFASTSGDESEYSLALLVYANVGAAQDAADAIDQRLTVLKSKETQQTYSELFGELGTLEPAQVVTDDATGLSVVVVSISKPIPVNEPVDGEIAGSHRPYLTFLRMVYARDTHWLVWGGGEE